MSSNFIVRLVNKNLFIFYAFGCAFCFGVHSYMQAVAMHNWRGNISILYPEFIPLMLGSIIFHIHYALAVTKPKTGKYWDKAHSALYRKSDGTFQMQTVVILLVRMLPADFIPINISLVTYLCNEIGIAPSVIQSFSSFSTFTTAVLFYFLYGERLTIQHIIGVVFIISSLFIVAIAK